MLSKRSVSRARIEPIGATETEFRKGSDRNADDERAYGSSKSWFIKKSHPGTVARASTLESTIDFAIW